MAHAFSFVKSQLTGQIGGGGEHQSVQFKAGAKTEEEKAAGLRKVSDSPNSHAPRSFAGPLLTYDCLLVAHFPLVCATGTGGQDGDVVKQ